MNIESILCILIDHISLNEQAKLKIVNKNCLMIINNYSKIPYLLNNCLFCSYLTQKIFKGSSTYCCNNCLNKYKNDIFDLGFSSDTVIKYK